jgi:hypothetical protein
MPFLFLQSLFGDGLTRIDLQYTLTSLSESPSVFDAKIPVTPRARRDQKIPRHNDSRRWKIIHNLQW